MAEKIQWGAKRNRDGVVMNNCWLSECGYTLALSGGENARYTLARPGEAVPFAYTPDKGDIGRLVRADKAAACAEGAE
jgi:hypothetical protein